MEPLSDIERFIQKSSEGIREGLNASYGDGVGADNSTAVGTWQRFTIRGLHTAAVRFMDPHSPITERLKEEELLMRFAHYLVNEVGVNPDTARKYIYTVQAWHKRRTGVGLGGDLEFHRLPRQITGYENLAARRPPKPKLIRHGVRPQWLARALEKEREGMLYSKLQRSIGLLEAKFENLAACAECGFAGLLRGAELTSLRFNRYIDVSRADVKLIHKGPKGPYAVIRTRNSKAKGAKRWEKIEVYLPSGGKYIDPYTALIRLFEKDPVEKGNRDTTPLFRDPESNKAVTVTQLRTKIKDLMGSIGLDKTKYGAHSLRIGGATALYALGVDALTIKTLGRWSSEAYMLYVRQCTERAFMAAQAACSKDVDDMAQEACFIDDDQYDTDDTISASNEDYWG